MSGDRPLLEVRGLCKQFPGVRALDEVDLRLYEGEVLAVIGENGAGKSTLMKILAGIDRADSGSIVLDGAPVRIDCVRRATELGIALIHQELNLAGNLDVAANIFLGREIHRWGFVNRQEQYKRVRDLLRKIELSVAPSKMVDLLSIGQQQMVEIAKALSTEARILIMDEPSSSLSQRETEQLYRVIRDLKSDGVSIIYISHRLSEVSRLADRVEILRDGKNAGSLTAHEIDHDRMISLMIGRHVDRARRRTPAPPGETLLEVTELRTCAHPRQPVTFSVRSGEIVGVAGLVGAGRTELLETIFAIEAPAGGAITVHGREETPTSPQEAIDAGIALVPENRKLNGIISEMDVRENISLASLRRDQQRGFRNKVKEDRLSKKMIGALGIRTPSDKQEVQFLSGGNQQKVVVAKWLGLQPKILLLDEPTRGIDVGAKGEIYALMEELAENGVAILFVSSDMEEILTMSDRVLVMRDGAISGELAHEQISEERIMRLAVSDTRGAEAAS